MCWDEVSFYYLIQWHCLLRFDRIQSNRRQYINETSCRFTFDCVFIVRTVDRHLKLQAGSKFPYLFRNRQVERWRLWCVTMRGIIAELLKRGREQSFHTLAYRQDRNIKRLHKHKRLNDGKHQTPNVFNVTVPEWLEPSVNVTSPPTSI